MIELVYVLALSTLVAVSSWCWYLSGQLKIAKQIQTQLFKDLENRIINVAIVVGDVQKWRESLEEAATKQQKISNTKEIFRVREVR
jgi:hypothetical protein